MKETKVHVRPKKMHDVISELEHAGVKNLNVIDVPAVGGWIDDETFLPPDDYHEKYYGSSKKELVCSDDVLLISIISDKAHPCSKDNKKIFVAPVTKAKI